MNLTEFLTARIAEVEAQARRIQAVGSCEPAYSPARVLAECEAKRQIVERATELAEHPVNLRSREDGWFLLVALALPYADHADFQEEWRV